MWCANTHLALHVVSDYDASSHWDIFSKVFLSSADEEEMIVWSSNFFSRDLATGPLAAAEYLIFFEFKEFSFRTCLEFTDRCIELVLSGNISHDTGKQHYKQPR